MRIVLASVGAVAIVFFIVAQFVGPEQHNGRIDPKQTIGAQTNMPANVDAILQRACNDCHSNATNWRWYGHIAPASWLLGADVYAGRQRMNLSQWGRYTAAQQDDRLKDLCAETRSGEMPLWYYRVVHYPTASLSGDDVKTLCDWSAAQRKLLNAAPERKEPGR